MKYQSTNFPIAREAWVFAVPVAFAALLSMIFEMPVFAVFLVILFVYILAFFRNPQRYGSANPATVLAPADGKIVSAGVVSHPDFEGGQALRIAIFMNVFNVHVNWAPCSGEVEDATYYAGSFLNAMEDKCAEENERKILKLRSIQGFPVVVKLVAGLVARRVVCPLEAGDRIEKGEKIGLIRFGSRVEVLLPVSSALQIENGAFVRGGETVIALFDLPERDSTTRESEREAGPALVE